MNIQNELKQNISKYVYYDNYIRDIEKKLDPIREKRKMLQDNIVYIVKSNNVPELSVQLPDGALEFVEKETTSGLNINYVKTGISNYFMQFVKEPKQIVRAQEQADSLIQYLLDNRPVKTNYSLKRNFKKQ
jgi:hypothetical protein